MANRDLATLQYQYIELFNKNEGKNNKKNINKKDLCPDQPHSNTLPVKYAGFAI
jgi:hypothetical protein|tara:strand:- start:972 stop:1133 length:162 start_codon:yes stop_codon:yes gene_type:complete